MIRKKLIRTILGGALSVAILAAMAAPNSTSYAATGTDIQPAFTDIQQSIDTTQDLISSGPFNTQGALPVSPSNYTHAAQFKGYTIQKGIDVSQWNGSINWAKVKASGVTFAFVRVGGRYYGSGKFYVDDNYRENLKGAIAAGLDVGVYFYSQATNASEAKAEAAYTMNLISGFNINLPIVMDYEYAWEEEVGHTGKLYNAHLSRSAATTVINTFCAAVEAKGYVGMLYASKTVITDDMNISNISNKYPVWSALYSDTDTDTLTAKHSYWQYTDSGTVPGIGRATDLNFRYIKNPAAPTAIMQQTSTDSSITLKWTKVPEVYGYQIARYDESLGKFVSAGTVKGASSVTFTDKNLQDGKKYTYKVRGYYKLNSGTMYGAYTTTCTGVTIADNIENFKVAATSANAVKLSWSPITAATGYRIYRLNPTTGNYESVKTLTDSTTSTYTDQGLNAGTDYSYKIRAYTTTESGTIWHVVSDKVTSTTLPGLVSGLKVSLSTSDSISLKWNVENNVNGYLVYIWDTDTATWTKLANVKGASQTTYKHTGLTASTQYNYSVRAYYTSDDKLKFTDLCSAASAYTGPAAPSRIVTKSRSANSIGFAWSRVPSATGYLVYKYDSNRKKYIQIAKITDNKTCTYTAAGLTATTGYTFAVRAYITNDGVSGGSAPTVLKTVTTPATTSAIKYMPIGGYRCTKWNKVPGATGYIVYKYDKRAKKYTSAAKLVGETSTTYIGPAVDARYYSYTVRAYLTYNKITYYGAIASIPSSATLKLTGVINDYGVRVRRGPSTNNSIITELTKGNAVSIIGGVKKNGQTWYKISFKVGSSTVTGYVRSDLMKIK